MYKDRCMKMMSDIGLNVGIENKTKRWTNEGNRQNKKKKDLANVDNVTVVDIDADAANNQC